MKSFFECVTGQAEAPRDYKPAGKLSLEKAFEVYQRGYVARLTEMLGDTYESVWKVLGDELFFAVAKEFITKNPSQSYNLSDYSYAFISFLKTHSVSEEFPFLPDLANMGWQQKELFNAPTEEGLAGEELIALLSDENAKGRFVSSFQMITSSYCLYDIWQAQSDETNPPDDWERPQALALYKAAHQVFVKPLSDKIYSALKGIADGKVILEACEGLSEDEVTGFFRFLALSRILTI
jgi:hypothetical protein